MFNLYLFVFQIDDIEGYPKFICSTCFFTIKTILEFINTYKDSQEILKRKFLSAVKKEEQESPDHSDYENLLEPIEYTDVKEDSIDSEYDFKESEIIVKPVQKVKRKRLSRNCVSKTNNVASSILEGVFSWTGERWWYVYYIVGSAISTIYTNWFYILIKLQYLPKAPKFFCPIELLLKLSFSEI